MIRILLLTIFLCSCSQDVPREKILAKMDTSNVRGSTNLRSIWSRSFSKTHLYAVDYKVKPLIMGSSVYLAKNNLLLAINKHNGGVKWSLRFKKPVSFGILSVNKDLIVAVEEHLHVIAKDTGKIKKTKKLHDRIVSRPVKYKEHLFIKTMDGSLICLDPNDLSNLWVNSGISPELSMSYSSTPVVLDHALVATGYSNGKFTANNLLDGSEAWSHALSNSYSSNPYEVNDVLADPVIADSLVFIAGFNGKVAAIVSKTGEVAWSKELSSKRDLVSYKSNIIVIDANSNITALLKKSGEQKWFQPLLRSRSLTNLVSYGRVGYIGADDGYVYELELGTGEILAKKSFGSPIVSIWRLGDSLLVSTRNGKMVFCNMR